MREAGMAEGKLATPGYVILRSKGKGECVWWLGEASTSNSSMFYWYAGGRWE